MSLLTPHQLDRIDERAASKLASEHEGRALDVAPVSRTHYFDWAIRTNARAEWRDGKVVLLPPASNRHEMIVEWLGLLVGRLADERLGGVVRRNMSVRLPDSERTPDLLYLIETHRDRLHATHVAGAPDLIVEVVSPDSVQRDRHEKFIEYEAAGVGEYVIVDPLASRVDVFARDDDGVFVPVDVDPFPIAALGGFRVHRGWLIGETLPRVSSVLPVG